MKLIVLSLITLVSCSSKSEIRHESTSSAQINSIRNGINSFQGTNSKYSNEENSEELSEENNEYSDGCKFEDGTYSATVDYNNPKTGYSATYILDVEVQDCQIVQINFPNGGYLDEDHITYADIDEDGYATVDGDDGKTYEIQIEN